MNQGITVSELSGKRGGKWLFKELSFHLSPGQALWIEGENGSGKSSLLRLLAGLALPFSGEVFWYGQSIQSIRSTYFSDLHHIGHTNGIKLGLSALENLQLARCLSSNARLSEEKVLNQLNLLPHQHTLGRYLSAGQKRRLALARLWLIQKPLWILDEPLTALDLGTQHLFLAQLAIHLEQGGMAILSSHHPLPVGFAAFNYLRLV